MENHPEALQYLDKDGNVTQALPGFCDDHAFLLKLYRTMVLTRLFDAKAIALQRTGKLGTYPSTLGQEAISTGMGAAMKDADVLCPYYREYGAQFWRGVKMEEILLYWGGDERGSNFQGPREDFPICVPIASQTLHATGVAMAFKLRKQKRAAVTIVGDGGTSRGDFYESMNMAGLWKLPCVFMINNNHWAISVPTENQTAVKDLYLKGVAAGIKGVQVDGNDVIAVTHAVKQALEDAYNGQGPTVIEALTYRLCDHTTADDAKRYRTDEEVKSHYANEPIVRLKKYLESQTLWDEAQEKALHAELMEAVNEAVSTYLETPVQSLDSTFDHMYAELPHDLAIQKQEAHNG